MARRKKPGANPRTVVGIIQDKSGSMIDRRSQTISGFNEYLETLKNEGKGEILLTLTQFDTRFINLYTSLVLSEVQPLNSSTYRPSGATALYDAVGSTIKAMEPTLRKDDKVVVVIMTDGYENSSLRWRFHEITALLNEKRDAGWEILFLGAGEDAWDVGRSLGFDVAHSISYGTVDAHDHSVAFQEVATSNALASTGPTAQAASSYLRSSPVKVALEAKAQMEVGNQPPKRKRTPTK